MWISFQPQNEALYPHGEVFRASLNTVRSLATQFNKYVGESVRIYRRNERTTGCMAGAGQSHTFEGKKAVCHHILLKSWFQGAKPWRIPQGYGISQARYPTVTRCRPRLP
jgi:hypothetical protein